MKFAVLGTAQIARKVIPGIQGSRSAEVHGVAGRNAASARSFADEFGVAVHYDGYQAALDDPEIDAVYLPLPPSLHAEWTIRAAEAGKHVLCEKPLACSVREVDEMIAACRQHNVVLLDGVMWYHTQRAQALREVVHSGQLGGLKQVSAAFTFRWDVLPMENPRMHRELGGGSLLDLGWYCVGAALLCFDRVPQRVFADAEWANDVDIRMNALMWFPDGSRASVECGFDTVRRRWLEAAGTQRTLYCEDFTRPWSVDTAAFHTLDGDGRRREYCYEYAPQETCTVDAFCDLVNRGCVSHPWLQLSRRTQLVCDLLDQSARTGQAVECAESDT